jgi:hypothetical protein
MTSTAHAPAHLHQHRNRRRFRALLVAALAATLTVPAGGLLNSATAATTYYVDPGSGCSNSGPGSSSQPFCAITPAAKVATAGDTVQVAAGEYREQVTAVSGVTYRATSPSAVVLGSDSLGGATWAATAGSAWTTVLPGTTVPAQVFAGASRLAKADSAATTSTNSWFFDAPTRTLSVDLGGASPAPSDQLEVSLRQYGFLARSTTGVVIDGFTVRRANGSGVMLDSSTGATVRNVRESESASSGVNDVAGSGNTISGVTATNNLSIGIRLSGTTNGSVISSTASRNGFHGVSVQGGTGARVAGVTADHNLRPGTRVAAGIDVSASSQRAVVERNRTFSNDDSGVEIYTGSSGAVVRRNLTYDNGDHGIDISNAADASVVSNTVVGNLASGLNVEGTSTGATVRNNIAADNAVSTPRSKGDIRVDKTSVAGSSIDRDLVFQSAGADPLYEWNGVTYTSLAALRSATGQEAHGRSGAPGFVSLPGRNLALTAGSPALDAADSGAPGWTANDFAGKAPVDQPDRADTGAGPVTYADLGALELTTVTVVDNAPQAALTATPGAATTDSPVKLDASGSTDDHGVTGYTFKCDTSSAPVTQTAATYTCTYPTAGTVHPSVTATDAAGHTSSAGATVTVTAAVVPAPTAALDVSPATVRQGGKVTLDGSRSTAGSAKAPLTKYTFDCGPGTAFDRTTSKADCTYRSTGRFTATLKVTDSLGRSATATRTVTVTAGARPHARLSVSDSTPRRRQVVRANASRSFGDAVSPVTAWKFRCGRATATRWSTRTTKSCTFRRTGRKVIRVWVRNDLGLVSTTYRVVRVHR